MAQKSDKPNPIVQAIGVGLLLWLSYEALPYRYSEWQVPVYVLWALTAAGCIDLLKNLITVLPNLFRHRRAKTPQGEKGTAQLGSLKDAKRAGLLKQRGGPKREHGFFIGLLKGKPVFAWIESCGMVLAPAGSGKTAQFVVPALMSNPMSMVVPDFKGTLAVITGRARAKYFRHTVHYFNPSGRFASLIGKASRYNPLQPIINYWDNPKQHHKVIGTAQSFAKQLITEPVREGENKFFRNGSRKLIVFCIVYLLTYRGTATLTQMLELLSDMTEFEIAVYAAMESDALGGDLARMAKDISHKLSDGDQRQFESFREGALQPLEAYSPSSALAKATEASDFSFADARKKGQSVYLMADPTQPEVYQDPIGLLMWASKTELMEEPTGKRVCFLIDEATAFKFEGLPSLMTVGREFGIVIWVILQEMEMWTHRYGKEAREVLLSQTEARVIMGTRSHTTAKLVSDELGEMSIRTTSYNTGTTLLDKVSRSVSEAARKVMTPYEVARSEKIILLLRQEAPLLLDPAGYHEVEPWRSRAAINPLFGKKYKGRVKARVG